MVNGNAVAVLIVSAGQQVVAPAVSASGRKEAARALREVGATITTDRGRNSSACTTTP